MEPQAVPVEFLPAPAAKPTDERFPALHLKSVRDLTAAIAATRLFISADTGPMHLASATQVPTVGLFRSSDPTLYRPLKQNDLVVDGGNCPPWLVAQKCHALWRLAANATYATV